MASDPGSAHRRLSSCSKAMCLFDWWLIRPDAGGKKTIGVAGTASRQNQAVRVFSSAAIVKRYDVFTVDTADGVRIVFKSLINEQKTKENGFDSEAQKAFTFGFPIDWEIFAEKSYGEEPTTEIASKKTKQGEGEEARLPDVFHEVFEDAVTEFPSGAGLDREAPDETNGKGVALVDDSGICVGTEDFEDNQNDSTRCSLELNSLEGCQKKSVSNSPLNFEKCLSPVLGMISEAIDDERPKCSSDLATWSRRKLLSGAGLDREAAEKTKGEGVAPVNDSGICVGMADHEVNQNESTRCSLKSNSLNGCEKTSVSNSPLNFEKCLSPAPGMVNEAINDRSNSHSGLATQTRRKLAEFPSGAGLDKENADETNAKGMAPVDELGIFVGTRDLEVNHNDSTPCSLKSNSLEACQEKSVSNSLLNIGKCLTPGSRVLNRAINDKRPKSYSGSVTRSRRKLAESSSGARLDREAADETKRKGNIPVDDPEICVGTRNLEVNQNDSTQCSLKPNDLEGCEERSVSNSPLNIGKCPSPASGVVNGAINVERPKSNSGLATRPRREAADEPNEKGAAPVDDPGVCVRMRDLEISQNNSPRRCLKLNGLKGCEKKSVSNSPLNNGKCPSPVPVVVNRAVNDERPESYSGLATQSRRKLADFPSDVGLDREAADETTGKGAAPVNQNDSTLCSLKSNSLEGCQKKYVSTPLNFGKCRSSVSGVINVAINNEIPKSYSGLATRSRRKLEMSGGLNVPSSPRDTLQEVIQDPDHEEEITTAKKAKRKASLPVNKAGVKEKSATRKKIKRQINFEEQGTPGGREDKAGKHIFSPKCSSVGRTRFGGVSVGREDKAGKHIVSAECLSPGRTKSGRLRLPTLEFWRNQTPVYDKLRSITGIQEELHVQTQDTGKSSRPRKHKK